jgi:hypothetical protein
MTSTFQTRILQRLPSPTWILIAALGGVLFAITISKGVQDPDYFWHVTTGKLTATSGQVPSVDPFSFTWAGQPWTPHEWLSELLIYALVSTIGDVGALIVFGAFPALIFAVLAYTLRQRRVRPLAIGVSCGVAAFVLVPYVTLRPQAVSWLLIAVLIGILWGLRPERPRRVLVVIPLFVLWANLHGLYVVGLGVLALFVLFTLIGRTQMGTERRWVLGAGAGAVLASMLTPAGPIGILYPLRYINAGDWGLENIQEWQSPNFHEPAHMGLLVLIIAVAINGGRATPVWLAALSYIGIAMSLLALRNAPVAAVFVVPTLAMGLSSRLEAWRPNGVRVVRPSLALGRRVIEIVAAIAVLLAAWLVVLPPQPDAVVAAERSRRFPVAAVDRLSAVQPEARVLAEYGWGGYVIFRMYESGGRVFVDGRNDMYSEAILNDYSAMRAADPGWQDLVESYGVDAMLFPPETTVTRGPALSEGWCEAYRDDEQVLYLRSCPSP